ncbi:hypothetical protein BDW67DRAFT_186386 [Aspergillus spinulosporus]
MAATNPKEWLCIIPDKPNVLELRESATVPHLENVGKLVTSEKLVLGGAMLKSHPQEGEKWLFEGSVIIVSGETAQEALEIVKNDAYATHGVWDIEKAQIIPFVSAIREPLKNQPAVMEKYLK